MTNLRISVVPFCLKDPHRQELIGRYFVQRDLHAQLQRSPKIDGAAKQQAQFGCLGCVKFVQRAVVATPTIVRRIRAQSWVT